MSNIYPEIQALEDVGAKIVADYPVPMLDAAWLLHGVVGSSYVFLMATAVSSHC
eukprot:SAG31_NODE_229_length_19770_cov_9.887194_5_plen_54_part_00